MSKLFDELKRRKVFRRAGVYALVGWVLVQVTACTVETFAAPLPQFEIATDWPQLPHDWKIGDPSSFAVDAQDNVWLLHRPRTLSDDDFAAAAPPVIVFNPEGEVINAWGGDGPGYEWPQREHFIHVDYQGFVWIGGNYCPDRNLPRLQALNDDQILKFSPAGEFILQIGRSNGSSGNRDISNLHQPADVMVDPATDELYVADGYGNHRVIVFDANSGEFNRMWGAFGNQPRDLDNCPPPALSSVPDGPGPDQLSIVHAIRVSNDGRVYVADRENRRVQVFSRDGQFIQQIIRQDIPFARNLELSKDREQQYLFVGGGDGIVVIDRLLMETVGSIAIEGMIGSSHQIATDSKGNIYIAGAFRGMQKLSVRTAAQQ
jgi:DNA-binding beta-propeller fold protein YncE